MNNTPPTIPPVEPTGRPGRIERHLHAITGRRQP